MVLNYKLIEELARMNTELTNVSDYFKNDKEYVMLLLYKKEDKDILDFLSNKADEVNVRSGYINIHTYSSKRPKLSIEDKRNQDLKSDKEEYAFVLMEYIGYRLGINTYDEFPIILLINTTSKSEYTIISLKDKNPNEIVNIFNKIIDILVKNYGKDFGVIVNAINDFNLLTKSQKNEDDISMIEGSFVSLDHLLYAVKAEYGITQNTIAKNVGMSEDVLGRWAKGQKPQKSMLTRIIDICYNTLVSSKYLERLLKFYGWKIDKEYKNSIYDFFDKKWDEKITYNENIEKNELDKDEYSKFKKILNEYEKFLNDKKKKK